MSQTTAHDCRVNSPQKEAGYANDAVSSSELSIYKQIRFKVTPEFYRQFTAWASSHDMSTTALLVDAFRLIQEQES
ncbi:MAG: hypothetical protein ABFS24_11235 [Pseudomonadota bacterium]